MGLETHYQAIPPHCELLRRCLVDAEFGHFLTYPDGIRRGGRSLGPVWKGEDEPFCAEVRRLIAASPGVEKRYLTLDRCFDMVEYLISPARRNPDSQSIDLGHVAVRGQHPLAEHLVGLRFTPAPVVAKIAEMLGAVQEMELQAYYDAKKMVTACVYKTRAQMWSTLWDYCLNLSRFYQSAATQTEGVLVYMV